MHLGIYTASEPRTSSSANRRENLKCHIPAFCYCYSSAQECCSNGKYVRTAQLRPRAILNQKSLEINQGKFSDPHFSVQSVVHTHAAWPQRNSKTVSQPLNIVFFMCNIIQTYKMPATYLRSVYRQELWKMNANTNGVEQRHKTERQRSGSLPTVRLENVERKRRQKAH
jgi:hypothetical protein